MAVTRNQHSGKLLYCSLLLQVSVGFVALRVVAIAHAAGAKDKITFTPVALK